ncbi:hypothetical protein Moror_15504, partial [Moniliophthora roreri MCA 2997]
MAKGKKREVLIGSTSANSITVYISFYLLDRAAINSTYKATKGHEAHKRITRSRAKSANQDVQNKPQVSNTGLKTRRGATKKGPKSVKEAEDAFNRAVEEKSNKVAEEKEAQKQHAHAKQVLAKLEVICEQDPSDDNKVKLEDARKLVADTLQAYIEAKQAVKAVNKCLRPLKGQICYGDKEIDILSDFTDIEETVKQTKQSNLSILPSKEPPMSTTPLSTSEPGTSEDERPLGVMPAPLLAVPDSITPSPSSTDSNSGIPCVTSVAALSSESVSLTAVPVPLSTALQPLPQAASSSADVPSAAISVLSTIALCTAAPAQKLLPQAQSSQEELSVATPTISISSATAPPSEHGLPPAVVVPLSTVAL